MRITRPLQSDMIYRAYHGFAGSRAHDVNHWYVALKVAAIHAYCPDPYNREKEAQYYAKIWADICMTPYQPFEGKTPEQLLLFARTVREGVEYHIDLYQKAEEATKK